MRYLLLIGLVALIGCADNPESGEPVAAGDEGSTAIPDLPGTAGEAGNKPAGDSQADLPDATSDTTAAPKPKIGVGAGGRKVLFVVPSHLNVRKGPGMDFEVVDVVTQGQSLNVVEEQKGWVKIGDERYVGRKHLDTTKPSN